MSTNRDSISQNPATNLSAAMDGSSVSGASRVGKHAPEGAELKPIDLARAEKSARRFWVTLIVGLLGLQVAGGITALVLAQGDSSTVIIPNYYQSAVNWDSTRRARQRIDELGWRVQTIVEAADERSGERLVRVSVLDRFGKPVTGQNLSASVFHHARGREVHRFILQESDDGSYSGRTGLSQAGVWQLDMQVEGESGIGAISRELWVE